MREGQRERQGARRESGKTPLGWEAGVGLAPLSLCLLSFWVLVSRRAFPPAPARRPLPPVGSSHHVATHAARANGRRRAAHPALALSLIRVRPIAPAAGGGGWRRRRAREAAHEPGSSPLFAAQRALVGRAAPSRRAPPPCLYRSPGTCAQATHLLVFSPLPAAAATPFFFPRSSALHKHRKTQPQKTKTKTTVVVSVRYPVYLVDFSNYKPPEELKVSTKKGMEMGKAWCTYTPQVREEKKTRERNCGEEEKEAPTDGRSNADKETHSLAPKQQTNERQSRSPSSWARSSSARASTPRAPTRPTPSTRPRP
jgi:hypothetical protein